MRALVSSLALLALSACGAEDSAGDGSVDAAQSAPDAEALRCDREGFATPDETAERDDELGLLFYTGTRGSAPMIERLTIDLYFALGAADEPHEFVFTGESLADCHTCVMVRGGCAADSCSNGKSFLAQSGTLTVDTIGDLGSRLTGSLAGLTFVEVTINPGDLETTPVPGGETWCLDDYSFDAAITGPL